MRTAAGSVGRLGASPPKPIFRLVNTDAEKIPGLLKQVSVGPGGAHLAMPVTGGEIKLELLAFPQPERAGGFWVSLIPRFLRRREESLIPVPLQIHPAIRTDEYKPSFHTQLMVHHPYAVVKDGTHYGLRFTAPASLCGQWEDFEALQEIVWAQGKKITEVGKKMKSLSAVARVDGGQPLIRMQQSGSPLEVFLEMLAGFEKPDNSPDFFGALISQRITVHQKKVGQLGVGEETKSKGTEENLIFTIPAEGTIQGNVVDNKGLIEVIVFNVFQKIIRQIIEEPIIPHRPSVRAGGVDTLMTREFAPGQTTFGEKRTEEVNISGVEVIDALAAFGLVLVGERKEADLEMTAVAEVTQAEVPKP